MEEKQIMDRTCEFPPRPFPCSLLAVLVPVPYQCQSPAHRFQPARCFRPARGSTPACRFPPSILLPALSVPIRKKGRKKSRKPSRTNGSARTGTKGNNLLMVLERSQLKRQEQMQWWFFEE
ncbi:hypothetical protein OUZ56_032762 [Daphnia magna]|uniref:Uncharacterized protein n=1 Tax=Daphnia magna TaxID=35525 RepID=A0ABQ9ZX19_9CRUS|nr:hypothetical protein OUZ56_032762 [Daphnia magna]